MNCCDGILFLGCFTNCDTITTLIEADYTGLMSLEFQQFDSSYRKAITVENGELIEIPNVFNENSSPIFRLKKADGTYVEVEDVSCFYIKNSLLFDLDDLPSGVIPPDPTGCGILTEVNFTIAIGDNTVDIGALAAIVGKTIYINGIAATVTNQYTISGTVLTVVEDLDDIVTEIKIIYISC